MTHLSGGLSAFCFPVCDEKKVALRFRFEKALETALHILRAQM